MGYATPEDAARGDVPAKYVNVVAVVVRGDQALVAQLTNDRPPYEIDTAHCTRDPDGTWDEDSSGNSAGGFLPTGDRVGTFVAWEQAPEGVVATRFVCQGRELMVPVERGCAVAVFDDVTLREPADTLLATPRLLAWIRANGAEEGVERHEPSAWLRERVRRLFDEQCADPRDQ